MIDLLVSGLVEGTHESARKHDVESHGQLRELPKRLAAFTPDAAVTSRDLKNFLHQFVYSSKELEEGRERSTRQMGELFEFFLAHPGVLPDAYREASAAQPLHRAVCDYIAGMTDAFFHKVYQQSLGMS